MGSRVYLDHNATSPMRPEVIERWLEVARSVHGNPSSLHASGRAARDEVDRAREEVARTLGASEEEIVFTSGGTESNNLALRGGLEALGPEAGLVTSRVEHSSVLETATALERAGRPVHYLDVRPDGTPLLDPLADLPRERPWLVSIVAANNEVGSLAHPPAIVSLLRDHPQCTIHVDAVQALGKIPVDPGTWGVHLASFSAHKIGGPPGVGVLWRERGTPLMPLFTGGGQEGDARAGTEDVPGIAATARAVRLAVQDQPAFAERARNFTALLWSTLESANVGARLFGPSLDAERLPNTLCIGFPGVDGKVAVTRLDLEGVEVSAGSACASGSVEPSHVLLAMGADAEDARAALRVSFGWNTTSDDCQRAANVLRKLLRSSRAT